MGISPRLTFKLCSCKSYKNRSKTDRDNAFNTRTNIFLLLRRSLVRTRYLLFTFGMTTYSWFPTPLILLLFTLPSNVPPFTNCFSGTAIPFTKPHVSQITAYGRQPTPTTTMDFINLVSTYRHGTPKFTGTETPSSQAIWTCFVVFMCINPVPIIILARLLSILSGRYCKNYLPHLGFVLLLYVCVGILCGPPRGTWSTILMVFK